VEITSINIKVVDNEPPVVAYCSFVIDDSFAVRKIRIISKGEEFIVCMPSIRGKDLKYSDVYHPINQMCRNKIVTAILNAYRGQLESEIA
jgi:DNA-binding cell septation regulator SpoVG